MSQTVGRGSLDWTLGRSGLARCLLLCMVASGPACAEVVGHCGFDTASLRFKGTAIEQAECLTRPVAIFGRVSPTPIPLPTALADLIGKPTGPLASELSAYLSRAGLDAGKLGGSLTRPVSRGRDGSNEAPAATYFVVHDTSSPWFGNAAAFPADTARELNDMSTYAGPASPAHVFVNRIGDTFTGHDFSVPWRATKLESQVVGLPAKGMFLHVEFLQPRRRQPGESPKNDAIAPSPGLTGKQYEKLALVYAMASARAGTWLVPPFHAAIDEGLPDGHDDPQNFDIGSFASALSSLRAGLGSGSPEPASGSLTGATLAATPQAGTPDAGAICARLQGLGPALAGGTPLVASGVGTTYKELFDACDATDKFAGKPLDIHDGKAVRCSTDKNRVAYVERFQDGTIAYSAKMAVDADGSKVIGGSGWPNNVQTWLNFDRGSELKFADAEDVPYVVVPRDTPGGSPSFQRHGRIGNGDLAVAIVGGRCSFGVVGDSGPWFRLGEAWLRTHEQLGNPQCKTVAQHPCKALRGGSGVGIDHGATYLIFPGSRPHPLLSQTVEAVATAAGLARADQFLRKEGR